jgi:hypothetical protein
MDNRAPQPYYLHLVLLSQTYQCPPFQTAPREMPGPSQSPATVRSPIKTFMLARYERLFATSDQALMDGWRLTQSDSLLELF